MFIVRQTRGQMDEQEHPCQSGRGPGQQPNVTSNGSMMPGFAANHYRQHQPRTGKKRHPPGRTHYTTQKIKKNSPGEQRCQPAYSRTIQFMVKEHSARELDQCRLDQKGYWRMGKGKIAIGDVAERYSV